MCVLFHEVHCFVGWGQFFLVWLFSHFHHVIITLHHCICMLHAYKYYSILNFMSISNIVEKTILNIMTTLAIAVSATLIFLFCTPSAATLLSKLQLPSPLTGPVALAFDKNGSGPYVGSSDGRIFKYNGPNEGFQEYAYTSPIR